MKRELLILGGGPAGMAAGYHAKKKNISFSIIESSNKVGGNCKTLSMGQFKYDTGAHRFHDKDKVVTRLIRSILKDDLIKVSFKALVGATLASCMTGLIVGIFI